MTREKLISYLSHSNISDTVFQDLLHNYLTPKSCESCRYCKNLQCWTFDIGVPLDFYCKYWEAKDEDK